MYKKCRGPMLINWKGNSFRKFIDYIIVSLFKSHSSVDKEIDLLNYVFFFYWFFFYLDNQIATIAEKKRPLSHSYLHVEYKILINCEVSIIDWSKPVDGGIKVLF